MSRLRYICDRLPSIAETMKIKSFLARPFASYIYKGIRKGMATAVADQDDILKTLLKVGRTTEFGKDSGLDKVNTYDEYKQAVAIRLDSIRSCQFRAKRHHAG